MRTGAKTMRKLTLLLAAMALAVLLAAVPAQAATTLTVNSTNDGPDANPGDGECSTAANECTLRAAIQEANTLAGDDVIGFDPSASGTITLGGSELLINSNLKINGPGENVVTVSANNQSRVFNVQGGTSPARVEISGLTITGGSIANSGSGIYNLRGDLTISNSTITDNTQSRHGYNGGGIYNSVGTLTVERSTISGNTASVGGGISNRGGILTVEQSTISGNTAWDGGGIYSSTAENFTTSKTTITNSTISGNTAKDPYGVLHEDLVTSGGGVYNEDGLTEIEHSTITNNSAPIGNGSGVMSSGWDSPYSDAPTTRTEVYSSIISANANTDVDFLWGPLNTFFSEGYNLIGDGNATDAFNKSADQINVTDPGLEPLSLNAPGSTMTHALKATSLAVNAGAPAECPATDQRGFNRPQENRCDIGSFERQVTPPWVTNAAPAQNATRVAPGTNVSALFSEAMSTTSVKSAFKLYKKGSTTAIRTTLTYDAATKRAVLNPSANLQRGATYKAVVTTGAKDLSGNALDQNPTLTGNQSKVWYFTIRR